MAVELQNEQEDVALPLDNTNSRLSSSRSCMKKYTKELKDRTLTLPATLLVLYTPTISICTVMAYYIIRDISSPPDDNSCWSPAPERNEKAYNVLNLGRNIIFFMIPIAGWAADTKIGRGSAIQLSLWTGWTGTLLQCLSGCFQYTSCGTLASIGKYGLSSIAFIFLNISLSFFYANALAYGIDQMICAPSVKIRAFIHWHVWALFITGNPIFFVEFLPEPSLVSAHLAVSVFACTLYTLCLCLHFHFESKFERLTKTNPYKILFGVLKYTWHHKYPENRSALTYWEDELPKRIDFAKTRFGGPFSHEAVENVKTFLRILVILCAASLYFMASDPVTNGIIDFVSQFKGGDHPFDGFTVFFIGDDVALLAIPLFELILLPLFPKLDYFLINPLRGIGCALISIILATTSLFLFDFLGRLFTEDMVPCYSVWETGDPSINLSYWIILIPSLFAGIADVLSIICIFEFLCSQAPSGMKGVLIGLFWFMRSLSIDIGSLISLIFKYKPIEGPFKFSCTSWLTLILGVLAIIGLILFTLASRWYVKRVRDEDLKLRVVIEEHFEQGLRRREAAVLDNHPINDVKVVITEQKDNNVALYTY